MASPYSPSLIEEVKAAGAVIDPVHRPSGVGKFLWLATVRDSSFATVQGYRTPEEVMQAREDGKLSCVDDHICPQIVWIPERILINPATLPAGRGHIAFMTDKMREAAARGFGGKHKLLGNPNPTAYDIWEMRKAFQAAIHEGAELRDATILVVLLWIPDLPDTAQEHCSDRTHVSNGDRDYGAIGEEKDKSNRSSEVAEALEEYRYDSDGYTHPNGEATLQLGQLSLANGCGSAVQVGEKRKAPSDTGTVQSNTHCKKRRRSTVSGWHKPYTEENNAWLRIPRPKGKTTADHLIAYNHRFPLEQRTLNGIRDQIRQLLKKKQ